MRIQSRAADWLWLVRLVAVVLVIGGWELWGRQVEPAPDVLSQRDRCRPAARCCSAASW